MKRLSTITVMLLIGVLSGAAWGQNPDTAYFWNGGYFNEEYQWHDTIYAGINQWIDIPVYFMGGPNVTIENLCYPLAARFDLIDEFSTSGQLYYPLSDFCIPFFDNFNDDSHPIFPNPPGYHSLSFVGQDRCFPDIDPELYSEVPLHIMSFRAHTKNDPALWDQTFSDALTAGMDPFQGPANADDTTGQFFYPLSISNACLQIIDGYEYLPGDVNMAVGAWPPAATGPDVTYLVNYFRGIPTSLPCKFNGTLGLFWASADVSGDCNVIGSDVTKQVSTLRGASQINSCNHYPPLWLTPEDLPAEEPPGWPNCENR